MSGVSLVVHRHTEEQLGAAGDAGQGLFAVDLGRCPHRCAVRQHLAFIVHGDAVDRAETRNRLEQRWP